MVEAIKCSTILLAKRKKSSDQVFECNVMVKSLPPQEIGHCGGMAERLKAHVLKTCLGHTNVGSNPTPSARRFAIDDLKIVNLQA